MKSNDADASRVASCDQNRIRPEQWAVANDYRNLPGGGLPSSRAALRDISYTAEQRARDSRWFGPNGVFGPARTLPSTATQKPGVGGRCQPLAADVIQGRKANRFDNADNEISNPITHDSRRGNEPARAPIPTWQANPATNYMYQANHMYPTPTTLAPSRMQQVADAQLIHAPRAPRRDLHEAGVSGNYRGDINNPRNLSANIPEDRSCSFWLRGLPADTTTHSLLAAVRGIGRVYCTVIAPANRPHGWPTAAAKLVLFEQAAAQRFWALYGRRGGGGEGTAPALAPFFVGGQRVVVERNRTRVAEASLPRDYTRVVHVTGPAGVVNVGALLAEFQAKFVFEMDEVAVGTEDRVTLVRVQRLVVVEFRFGSFRCQAQTAHRLLQGRAGLEVRYGRDPCDR